MKTGTVVTFNVGQHHYKAVFVSKTKELLHVADFIVKKWSPPEFNDHHGWSNGPAMLSTGGIENLRSTRSKTWSPKPYVYRPKSKVRKALVKTK